MVWISKTHKLSPTSFRSDFVINLKISAYQSEMLAHGCCRWQKLLQQINPFGVEGIVLANRRKQHKKELKQANEAGAVRDMQMQQQVASREVVLQLLKSLSDKELNQFVDEVCSSAFLSKKRDLIVDAVFEGRFPEAGLAAAEVKKVGLKWIEIKEGK